MWTSTSRCTTRAWANVRGKLKANDTLLSNAALNGFLAQILTLPLPPPRMRTEEVGATVALLAAVLPSNAELLVTEFMQVLRYCFKEKLILTSDHLNGLLPFCMQALQQCPSWYAEDILMGMVLILNDNAERCKGLHETIFNAGKRYLDAASADAGARYAATQCMTHILHVSTGTVPSFAMDLWNTMVDNFLQQSRQLHGDSPEHPWSIDRVLYKTCIASMECLLALLQMTEETPLKQQIELQLATLLSSLRQILGCGLHFNGRANSISDSDSESTKRSVGLSSRLRLIVVRLLDAILRFSPSTITNSITMYLPDKTSTHMLLYNQEPSILTLIISDSYELVRLEALKWLEHNWQQMNLRLLLTGAKQSTGSFPFKPLSTTALLMVIQTHLTLLHVIRTEVDAAVMVQALKTLTLLSQQCPYTHMERQLARSTTTPSLTTLLHAILSHVHTVLFMTDHSIRVAALACMSSLLSTNDPVPSILAWLKRTDENPVVLSLPLYKQSTKHFVCRKNSFLFEMIGHAKAIDSHTVPFHRLDAMALLSKVAKNYAPALSGHWDRFSDFLLVAFRDVDQNVRLQAVKILENYIKGETHHNYYLSFLSTHVVRAFQDPSHHVRASVCACFTLLRESDWAILSPREYQSIFLSTPKDASPVVRAAGFRLLGALVLLPCFKTREFVSNVVRLGMELSKDTTLNVRVRVVWAIGNACTTPGPDSTEAQDMPWLIMLLEPDLVYQVLECMLAMVDDNDKVASSVVRTMGLVARWLCAPPYLSQVAQSPSTRNLNPTRLLTTAMESLAKKIGDGAPKVRWNSCHALAKIFQSPQLPVASAPWTPTVFTALRTAIQQQENFKVRISAAMALRVSLTRVSYGNFYERIVTTIVDALDTVVELKDIQEFKYKPQLELQLSFTLLHLVAVANPGDDEVMLGSILARKYKDFVYDWLYHHQHKIYAAIFGDEVDEDPSGADEGHEVNPLTCGQVVQACNVLHRVVQTYCPHTTACLAQIAEVKMVFEMDLSELKGFEF
ncbi:hypothetical protein THRCLA_01687 [Thraustotheca clavata]|uniref:DUF4042 domain-containing protein n=1 Tax=Thraustotheca clavata TaxID=74557 RepID=A0A1W0A7I6_9STRA|nr:hypothetical protein THRCLA_01687 [Thraustotheca clavata]